MTPKRYCENNWPLNTTFNLYLLFKVHKIFFSFSANSGIPASAIGNGVQEFMDGNDEFGEDTHRLEPILWVDPNLNSWY